MIISELIKKLETFNNDLLVVVKGMDGEGYNDLETIEQVSFGNQESNDAMAPEYQDGKTFQGLLLDF